MSITFVAHRGNCQYQHENSLASVRDALTQGINHIEIDIQITRDGIPVLFHDDNLNRYYGSVTAIENKASIANYDFNELIAHYFEPSAAKHADKLCSKRQKITPLSDIVNLIKSFPDSQLFVEVKSIIFKTLPYQQALKIIENAIRPIQKQCVVISFSYRFLRYFKQLQTQSAIGYVLPSWLHHCEKLHQLLAPNYIFCDEAIVPINITLSNQSYIWVFYEIDSISKLNRLYQQGATWFETFQPATRRLQLSQS